MRLQPAACRAVVGCAPAILRGQSVPCVKVNPELAEILLPALNSCRGFEAAVETFSRCLSARNLKTDDLDGKAAQAAHMIACGDEDLKIERVAAAVGLSVRQLQRRFLAAVGITPKQFARVRRIRRIAVTLAETDQTESGPNQRRTFTETENVQSKLGGLVVLFEGVGKNKPTGSTEEVVVHNAFAVVAYDDQAKTFRWRAYRAEQSSVQSVDSEAKVGDKTLESGFKDPRGFTIRFTIKLDEKGQWFEIGEFSPNGENWQKFFEMTLQRVGGPTGSSR